MLLLSTAPRRWASRKPIKLLLMAPAAKFLMGCAAFLLQVILSAWNKCRHSDVDQIIGLVVGIMSMGMVVMTALFLVYDAKK